MKVVKNSGVKQDFDEDKLWHSLYYPARESHYSEEEAMRLADEAREKIIEQLDNQQDQIFTAEEIRKAAIKSLEEIDTGVALIYEKHLDLS